MFGDNNDEKKQKKQQENASSMKMLALLSQFGISMLVPIFICFFAGYYLDRLLGTSFIMIILFFVGAIAGFRNIYVLSKRMTKKSDAEIERESIINKK